MEKTTQNQERNKPMRRLGLGIVIGILLLFVFFDIQLTPRFGSQAKKKETVVQEDDQDSISSQAEESTAEDNAALQASVLPEEGIELPFRWNDIGKQLTDAGVIDMEKFESLYAQRGGLTEDQKSLLVGSENGGVVMDAKNASFLLNVLWAFGLANKNTVLEQGPMQDPQYGGADGFASTGGWSLASGTAMEHYSAHEIVKLTPEQQQKVENTAKNIYRPCCGNSTYFPDCNHGMAMLGLLQLMAAQDMSEEEMYDVALQVNAYWFPQTYLTLAKYFEKRGIDWENVDAQEVLGSPYSSSSGYRQILTEVEPAKVQGGGGCGV